jgi:hypothetical protein
MRRTIAMLSAGLILTLAGCGDDVPPGTQPRDTGAAVQPSAPTASVPASVASFQSFSGLTIPAGAQQVEVRTETNAAGDPVYRVSFRMPSDQTDRFCADGGMGGQLQTTSLPADLRTIFGYHGKSTALAVCEASLPSDGRIQRQVLVVGTDQPSATVQVYAYQMRR